MKDIKLRFLIWGCGEIPEAKDLEKAIEQVYNGRNLPAMMYVKDTNWDQYTLAVSSERITETETQVIWDNLEEKLKNNPKMNVYEDIFEYKI